MQMVEMRVRDQNVIDGRQVLDADARYAQAFQNEQPLGKVGVDQDILPADLQKESGVSDECDGEVLAIDQHRLAGFAGATRPR